jgi:hypothetical protein
MMSDTETLDTGLTAARAGATPPATPSPGPSPGADPAGTAVAPASTAARRASFRRGAGVLALFLALTLVFTWPQAIQMRTGLVAHQDPLFSAWRLGWIAHALFHEGVQLFEGNILYPAHRTLAYSDAMLLQGVIAAPFIRLGASPLLMVNVLWFVSLVASAGGMYLLARRLTGNTSAAILAGIIFTFAPYRAEHIMHLELNWAQWIPLTLWALHRALTEDRLLAGVLTGVFIALQLLSCIYYAVYLLLVLAVIGLLSLWAYRRQFAWRALVGLAAGALIVAAVAAPYSSPYRANVRTVGTRADFEIKTWSSTPSSFLATTPENLLYGRLTADLGTPEARQFPGLVAIVLLVIALLPPFNATRLIYAAGLAFAAEASLGLNGWLYPILLRWLPMLDGLRAPGRMGIFVLVTLGVLAAYGLARLQTWVSSPRLRAALPLVLCSLLGLEYIATPIATSRLPTEPPPIYQWLARLPHPTLIAEFPLMHPDPTYMYFSTMHWQPMVNGYSGFRPSAYVDLTARFEASFPDDKTMEELRRRGVRAIIVHKELYPVQRDYAETIQALAFRSDVEFVARWKDHIGEARAYLVPLAPAGPVPSLTSTSQAR